MEQHNWNRAIWVFYAYKTLKEQAAHVLNDKDIQLLKCLENNP